MNPKPRRTRWTIIFRAPAPSRPIPPPKTATVDGFVRFLSGLRATPLLTAAEEAGACSASRRATSSSTAADRGQPPAGRLPGQEVSRARAADDRPRAGCLGLIRAVDRFDWRREIPLHDLRDAVDPSGDEPQHRRQEPLDASPHIAELQPTVARVEQMLLTRLAREPTWRRSTTRRGSPPTWFATAAGAVSLSSPDRRRRRPRAGRHDRRRRRRQPRPRVRRKAAWLRRAMESRHGGALRARARGGATAFRAGRRRSEDVRGGGTNPGVTREAVRLIEARAFKKLGLADVQRLRAD